jgi:hypothetical protein
MNPIDFIEINKLSYLHNNSNTLFCKTDYIFEAFRYIQNINQDIVFITGNSDYCITDHIVNMAPKNIKIWFCQNRLSDHPLLKSIPLGLENTLECKIEGHGLVWPHAREKPDIISKSPKTEPSKLIYANFSINTNPAHRSLVQQICQQTKHITWTEPSSNNYKKFISDILQHKAVVCPQGNGPGDNHRIYETLYLKRVPITFNPIQYKYLHRLFPVLLLENEKDLYSQDLLPEIDKLFIEVQKNNCFLSINTWLDLIKKQSI